MRNRIYELHKNMIAVSAACSRKENTQETADDRKNATVTYNFATGDMVTIELEEGTEVSVYITESKRLEENEARRIRYNEIKKRKKEVCRKQRQQGMPWILSVRSRKNL